MHKRCISIFIFSLVMILFFSSEISAGRYYDPKFKHFIQPDPTIPDIYNPQALNRYSYVYNNPYKYIDPTGKEPVLPQIGSYEITYNQLQQFEAQLSSNNPGLTAQQTLSNLVTFAGTFNSQTQIAPSIVNDARYVYTSEKGFVDNLHFFAAAAQTKQSGAISTTAKGYVLEGLQFAGFDTQSAFSYEDLSSNRLGIEFAGQLNDKGPLSEQYKKFIESKGGSIDPLGTLEKEHPGLSANIPSADPSGSPATRHFTSQGKALPTNSPTDKSSSRNRNSFFGRFRSSRR